MKNDYRLTGLSDTIQLGKNGPFLKKSGNDLIVSTDVSGSTLSHLTVANPSTSNHAVNLSYLNTALTGMMTHTVYSFSQDSITLADGEGTTIGSNLDASTPVCNFGDFILVAAGVSLQGVTVTGYVHNSNTIRIRVQNETGGSVTLASTTWKVSVIRTI